MLQLEFPPRCLPCGASRAAASSPSNINLAHSQSLPLPPPRPPRPADVQSETVSRTKNDGVTADHRLFVRVDAAMERKRKLPARAAARVEHIAKKRTATPPERSVTPVSATTPTSQPPPEAPAQLPKSVQSGMPLPTVEDAQPDDLPLRDYQNIQERYDYAYARILCRLALTWL